MNYDLAIIGGGPAGLIAAFRASELGKKIILIEKNNRPGIKLLMTGGGRCNLTNNILDYRLMANKFGKQGNFLLSAFSRFGVKETITFFENQGLKIKIEKDNQVFPKSNKALDVLDILTKGIKKFGGQIITNNQVEEIIIANNKITSLTLSDKQTIKADNYLIATGGLTYPMTGSNGDGYRWLKKLGHTTTSLYPALAPIIVKENFIKMLEGISLENVALRLYNKNKIIAKEIGPIIFTSNGLSGPAILNLSRFIDFKTSSNFSLEIDLLPQYSKEELKKLLINSTANNKLLKNNLEKLLPLRLIEALLEIANINNNQISNSLKKSDREKLNDLLKKICLTIKSVAGYEKAMVTAGGINLKEIDPKTMRSKIISNLFIAGEILDLTGPTGGYNLQLCWSTGWIVGNE